MTATKFDDNDLRASARRVMATMAGDSHPEPGELLSYHAGELGEAERQRVQNHLAACPECTRTVLDMASFPEVEPHDPRLARSEEDVARLWEGLRERLRDEAPGPGPQALHGPRALPDPQSEPAPQLRPQAPSPARRAPGSRRYLEMLAAALLLVCLGLSWALLSQRRVMPDAPVPRLNLPIVQLAPASAGGQRGAGETVRLPPEADGVFLSLVLVSARDFAAYEIEVVAESDGRTAWHNSKLRKNSQGIFAIELPRDFLPAGGYRLEVRGVDGERRDPLATYRLTLVYE